jgi:hypothetical protein
MSVIPVLAVFLIVPVLPIHVCVLTSCMMTAGTQAGPHALQVTGNVKGVFASVLSVVLFRNNISALACLGYAITVAGSAAYGRCKRQ